MRSPVFREVITWWCFLTFFVACCLPLCSYAQTCTPATGACNATVVLCCSGVCTSDLCEDGCTVSGYQCDDDTECCSGNCYEIANQTYTGLCQVGSGGCTGGDGQCTEKAQCCSYNCYDGICQSGANRCTFPGGKCIHDIDCCEGSRCWDNGVCSGALGLTSFIVTSYVTGALVVLLLFLQS